MEGWPDSVARLPPPKRLAPRDPSASPRWSTSDTLERFLHEDGHRAWGFVIYRCTYKSDSDWDEFVRRLRAKIENFLRLANGLDLMDNLALTVFDDKSKFDGASTSVVREHFKQWAATAPQLEQGTGPGSSQRYNYCIHVNDEALDSIVHNPLPPELARLNRGAFVNLIRKNWEPWDGFVGGERIDGSEAPIEGCTLFDVGWFRVQYDVVMPDIYCNLRDVDEDWDIEYLRPPGIREF